MINLWVRLNQKRSTYFLLSGLESIILFLAVWGFLSLLRAGYALVFAALLAAGFLAYCIVGDYLEAYTKAHIGRYRYPGLSIRNVTPYEWFRLASVAMLVLGLIAYGALRYW